MSPRDRHRNSLLRVLTGPTASGKEAVALRLAPLLGAEVVSLDSMKLYRGMDVGTSKVPPAARREVRHHLLDIADPSETMTVSHFCALAEAVIDDIASRGKAVLVVGGTAMYLKGLLYGVFEGPGADLELRAELEAEAAATGIGTLHARLAGVDPEAARRIHATDLRRVVRALEVHTLTGRPISSFQTEWKTLRPRHPHRLLALRRPRPDLHARIAARVAAMVRDGLVEEVERLRAAPGGLGRTASQAIGYREIGAFLDGEVATLEEALETVRTRTNRLARAQETWLRSFPGMEFLEVPRDEAPEVTARRALAALSTEH